MPKNEEFWNALKKNAEEIYDEWSALWPAVGTGAISQKDALHLLEVMWKRSHLDIMEHIPAYKPFYPTKQLNTGRLKKVENLWWVDHATAGVNGWGTLGWFSSKQRDHAKKFSSGDEAIAYAKRRSGLAQPKGDKWVVTWKGYAGASTHFVVLLNGLPFYLVNLDDGCWGEPKRNGDGIHVEMVNPLRVTRKKDDWYFWAGPIPKHILEIQHPAELDKQFRGCTHMLPYTWEQVITNIKLKRLCVAATEVDGVPRMARDRMSQHTDWKATKLDMGPLWPFKICNDASFENFPIEDYDFMKQFVNHPDMDPVADPEEVLAATLHEAKDPDSAYQGHDILDADESIDSTIEVQKALLALYGPTVLPKYGADGSMGKETTVAIRKFQENWNRIIPKNRLSVDGIPGVFTCASLTQALLLHSAGNFPTT